MDREAEGPSRAVHVRLPMLMWHKIARIADKESLPVASVLRRLAKERLDQLEGKQWEDR